MSEKEIKKNKKDNGQRKIIELAKDRFKQAEEAESETRAAALDDLSFRAGDQWPVNVLNSRKLSNRPALTINKIPQFVRQIANEMRLNKPSIKVYPVDDLADVETAKVLQGMIRNIEYTSNADVAYCLAGEGAVEKGFGYFRLITDYSDAKSFDQEIKIKPIYNHFSVYLDPASQEIDGSDANWAFIFDEVSKDEHLAMYPDSEASQMTDWTSIGDQQAGWFSNSRCRVAEYFYKEFKTVKICQVKLASGEVQVFEKDSLPQDLGQAEIINERETLKTVIKWCKINGMEVLEETEWPGSYIPVFPVYGARVNLNGRWIYESVFRHSKDSQRMLNYMASSEAEAIGLAPKAPFIVAEGQIPPEYEQQWKTANQENHSYLVYKPTSIAGQPIGAPSRNAYEAATAAITKARMMASDDIKATTGIYDASLGQKSNEQSGIAIQRRNAQAQTSNYHFIDNLAKTMQHAGRVMVEIIPVIYDTARIARIIGDDGEKQVVEINKPYQKAGQRVVHNLSVGKYDVVVDVGPSYETKRQEAAQAMLDFLKIMPQQSQVIADLMVKNMDWPGAQEISERLKKMLPPGIEENPEKPVVPPEAQQMLSQQAQLIEQMTAKLQELSETVKSKEQELESKERIEFAKLQTQAAIELAKLEHDAGKLAMVDDVKMIKERLSVLDMDEEIDEDFNPSGFNDESAMEQNNEQGNENEYQS